MSCIVPPSVTCVHVPLNLSVSSNQNIKNKVLEKSSSLFKMCSVFSTNIHMYKYLYIYIVGLSIDKKQLTE